MTVTLDDLPRGAVALLTELIAIADAGEALPSYAALGARLNRDKANVRKSVLWLEARELIAREPFTVSDEARSLLLGGAAPPGGGLSMIPLDAIEPSGLNPRRSFDDAALQELADSLAEKGVIQPLFLRPHPDTPNRYQIAAGERRWRASRLNVEAGHPDWPADRPMPATVRALTDEELIELAIAENQDRQDVHPLDEAEAYSALAKIREDRGEYLKDAAAAIAGRLGKSGRFVELRIALARKLGPAARTAFEKDQIPLWAARELAKWPEPIQRSAVQNIIAGYHGWSTAEAVRSQLKSRGLSADIALFQREAYDGPVIEADGEPLIYADRALAERLQRQALETLADRLREDGWAEVRTDEPSFEDRRGWADEHVANPAKLSVDQRAELTLLLGLDHQLRLRRRTVRPASMKTQMETARTKAETGERRSPDGGAGAEPQAGPFERRHWRQAKAGKTERLQAALSQAPARFAMAVTVIALSAEPAYHADQGHPFYWLSGKRMEGDDREVPPAARANLCKAAAEFHGAAGARVGIEASRTGFTVTDAARALPALLASPALERIFICMIAAQAGSWPGYQPGPGDQPAVIALSEALGDLMPAFTMTEDYLTAFSRPQLARIADACIRPGDRDNPERPSAAMPRAKAEAVTWILNHLRRDLAWTPPEMTFDSPAAIEQACAALMMGEQG